VLLPDPGLTTVEVGEEVVVLLSLPVEVETELTPLVPYSDLTIVEVDEETALLRLLVVEVVDKGKLDSALVVEEIDTVGDVLDASVTPELDVVDV
jgi:hypothetical protein